jgi:hypothetical protein
VLQILLLFAVLIVLSLTSAIASHMWTQAHGKHWYLFYGGKFCRLGDPLALIRQADGKGMPNVCIPKCKILVRCKCSVLWLVTKRPSLKVN